MTSCHIFKGFIPTPTRSSLPLHPLAYSLGSKRSPYSKKKFGEVKTQNPYQKLVQFELYQLILLMTYNLDLAIHK